MKDELDKLDANGKKALTDNDLANFSNYVNKNMSQNNGGSHINIHGMTMDILAQRQEHNGRVVLPIDRVKQNGVGFSFRIRKN